MHRPDPRRAPSSAGDAERERRIEAVLDEVGRRIDDGERVDPEAIQQAHQELMPELANDLRQFLGAQERARIADLDEDPADSITEVLDEELTFLRQALEAYELLERIRYGGQGVVYRARQRGTHRIVALKVLLDGPLATQRQRARFAREIELVARLRHPNIVTVYESGVVRGRHYYTMEFIEGDPIDDYAALVDLGPQAIVRLLIKVARAVHHAHQNGVIHRDLNPANILVDEAGEPHVFDFGLAQDLRAAADGRRISRTDQGCGTLPYLSPEQAGGNDGTDVRSDVYALGLILYELLTDMFPYPIRGEPGVVRRAIVHDEPVPLRRALAHGDANWARGRQMIDRDLEAVVAQALAKSKEDRYQTAAGLADDLERWLARDAVAARGRSGAYRLRKALRRHKIAVGFTAVVLSGIAATVAGTTYYGLQAEAERDRARVQRDNARRAARMAYDLFELTLTDVEQAVRPLAGGVAVRDRLIGRLSDRLPELAQLTAADGPLEQVARHLLEKQGDIALQQARRSEALAYYQKFLDDSLRAASTAPGRTGAAEYAAAVVRAYRKLGEAAEDPVPVLERGREFGENALRSASEDEETRYELCRLILLLEAGVRNAGQHQEALAFAERVLELCQTPGSMSLVAERYWQGIRAEALTVRGLTLHKLGEGVAARSAVEQGLALRECTVAANPADTEARFSLLWSYTHLGTLLRDAGELEPAKSYLRQAAEQGRILALMDPSSTTWAHDRYSVHHRLASLCIDTGDLVEAKRESEAALAIAEKVTTQDETDAARTTLYFALMLKGKVCRSERNWQDASDYHAAALATAEQMLVRSPGSPDLAERVVNACDALAYCANRSGNSPLALAYRQRVYALQAELFDLQPERTDRELNLVQAETNLASIQCELGTPEACAEATRLLAEAEQRLDLLYASGKLVGLERRHQQLTGSTRDLRVALGIGEPDAVGAQGEPSATDRGVRP